MNKYVQSPDSQFSGSLAPPVHTGIPDSQWERHVQKQTSPGTEGDMATGRTGSFQHSLENEIRNHSLERCENPSDHSNGRRKALGRVYTAPVYRGKDNKPSLGVITRQPPGDMHSPQPAWQPEGAVAAPTTGIPQVSIPIHPPPPLFFSLPLKQSKKLTHLSSWPDLVHSCWLVRTGYGV